MKFNDAELVWAMDTLAQNGHPDPHGLIAKMESSRADELNVAGVSKEEAVRHGVPFVNEPAMSMFAALSRDVADPDPVRYHRYENGKRAIGTRTEAALYRSVVPKNPFVDTPGRLVMKRNKATNVVGTKQSEDSLRAEIAQLMDEYR